MSVFRTVFVMLFAVVLVACQKDESNGSSDKKLNSDSGSSKPAQIDPATNPNVTPPVLIQPASGPRISRDPAINASPLGVEIGYANLDGVKHKFKGVTNLVNAGTSDHTGGVILQSDGQGLGVDGLQQFVTIFDKNGTLVAVSMTMPKRVKDTYSKLSEKYTPVSNNIDQFMDYGSAKLQKGDSFVIVEADHLSFAMSVVYATKDFLSTVEHNTAEANAKKEQEQKDKL